MPVKTETTPRHRHRRRTGASAIAALVAAGGVSAGLALGASGSTTVKSAANAKLGETIVVDSGGRTLYALKPETRAHVICTSTLCQNIWPPYTVSRKAKLKAGRGVKGKLRLLPRNGSFQVTLNGLPLYHFSGDSPSQPGQANGDGINSFGGHWHVIKASSSKSSSPAPTTTNTMPSYTQPGY